MAGYHLLGIKENEAVNRAANETPSSTLKIINISNSFDVCNYLKPQAKMKWTQLWETTEKPNKLKGVKREPGKSLESKR